MESMQNADMKPNPSPVMFCSDEELDEEELYPGEGECTSLDDSIITVVKSQEEQLIGQIRLVMTGVPPPPSFTTSKLDTLEILRLWNDNQHLVTEAVQNYEAERKFLAAAVELEAKQTTWPQVVQITCFGVSYNKSKASEELEWLFSKYRERFVGNETASWINSCYFKSPVRTASAKKRARYSGWRHSPGRRLSHLARRKRAFTSANLQNMVVNNSGLPRNKKMILVEMKKPNNRQKIKSNNSLKKQPFVKINNLIMSNNHKRALFQSPDDKPFKVVKSVSMTVKQSPNQQRIQRSKRALWPKDEKRIEFNCNGKRERNNLTPSPKSSVSKPASTSCLEGNIKSMQQSSPLSNPHQKKLLWAISQALRDEGIRMNHQLFQSCLSVLNGPCMTLWIWKTSKEPSRGSTSENMLALVKQFPINMIIEQVQENSSSSNLISLRLGLMKKVEAMKSQVLNLKKDKNITVIKSCELTTDKENISRTDSSVPETSYLVYKKSPLKDNNLKCDDMPFKDESNSSCTSNTISLDNCEIIKSVKNDDELVNSYDGGNNEDKSVFKQKNNLLKSAPEETIRLTFSDMLSWNADPISRLQKKAPDFKPSLFMVDMNSTSIINNLTINNTSVLFEELKHNASTNDDNLTVEFENNDDETQSSSVSSFNLNNFADESRTCFEFTVPNILASNMCSDEEM